MVWKGGGRTKARLDDLGSVFQLSERRSGGVHQPDLVFVIQGPDPHWQGQGLEFRAGLSCVLCGSGEGSQSELGATQSASGPLGAEPVGYLTY